MPKFMDLVKQNMAGAIKPVGLRRRAGKKIVTARPEQVKIATNHMWYDRGDGGSATLKAEHRLKVQAANLDAFKRRTGQATVQRTISDYDAEF